MKTSSATISRVLPFTLGGVVFLAVCLLVIISATLITFILPEAFASSCRIKVDPPLVAEGDSNSLPSKVQSYEPILIQTELEIIRSEVVLSRVIEELDLNTEWGKKYLDGAELKTTESLMILRGKLDLRTIPGTSLVEVKVFSDRPDEAAMLANAITESYAAFAALRPEALQVQIVDTAHPSIRPVKPNKPLNIALGVVVGVLLGLVCGALTFWVALVLQRRKPAAR